MAALKFSIRNLCLLTLIATVWSENDFGAFVREFQKLKEKVNIMENSLQECTENVSNLTKIVKHESKQKRLLLGSNLQETGSEHHVAFYAHLSKNVDNVGHHQPIVFDTVDYNDGRAYNAVDGEFITKVAGTYMFIWTISARDNTYMETELVVNGVVFGHVIADAAQHTDWGVATGFAITKLSIGDHVWVRSGTIISGHLTGVGFGTSSFAGFLMYH